MNAGAQGTIYHPGFGEQLQYRADVVSDDPDTQVSQVISMMSGYTKADTSSPEIAEDVAAIRTGGTGDPLTDTFRWVQSHLSFVRDEQTAMPFTDRFALPIVETLVRPRDMTVARRKQGDCDDYVMYGATLLRAQGIAVNYGTVAASEEQPTVYSHVYVVAYPGGRRVPVDFSHGPYPGWEAPNYFGKQKEWMVDVPTTEIKVAALVGLAASLWLYFRRKRRT